MKITIEIENEAQAMFALHLAQRDNAASDMSDYFLGLHWDKEELHEDTRYCSNPECGAKVIPACTTTTKKHVPNPFCQCEVSTRPIEECPECGAKTVTVEEHLTHVDACTKWIAHMRAKLAAARAFPERKYREPFGTEPAPMIRVIAEPTKATRKASKRPMAGVSVAP